MFRRDDAKKCTQLLWLFKTSEIAKFRCYCCSDYEKILTPHAAIIGITGLGIGLIEEVIRDNGLSIIIDPKGG
jgi:hypothetical protein